MGRTLLSRSPGERPQHSEFRLPCPSHPAPSPSPPMDIRNINRVPAFITKDGSEIRELLAERNSSIRRQSLAEARLPVGASTTPHHHPQTEEIYYILAGTAR